jgi:hypothetical protein
MTAATVRECKYDNIIYCTVKYLRSNWNIDRSELFLFRPTARGRDAEDLLERQAVEARKQKEEERVEATRTERRTELVDVSLRFVDKVQRLEERIEELTVQRNLDGRILLNDLHDMWLAQKHLELVGTAPLPERAFALSIKLHELVWNWGNVVPWGYVDAERRQFLDAARSVISNIDGVAPAGITDLNA